MRPIRCRPSRRSRRVEKQAGVGNVWSLETLRRWLAEKAGSSDVATLKEYVNLLPEYLVRRFISANQDAVWCRGAFPIWIQARFFPWSRISIMRWMACEGASRLRDRGHRPFAIAARNSASMIEKLNRG